MPGVVCFLWIKVCVCVCVCVCVYLLYNIEGKLQPLSLQHGDQVSEQDGEMFLSVPEGDEDGHLAESTARFNHHSHTQTH